MHAERLRALGHHGGQLHPTKDLMVPSPELDDALKRRAIVEPGLGERCVQRVDRHALTTTAPDRIDLHPRWLRLPRGRLHLGLRVHDPAFSRRGGGGLAVHRHPRAFGRGLFEHHLYAPRARLWQHQRRLQQEIRDAHGLGAKTRGESRTRELQQGSSRHHRGAEDAVVLEVRGCLDSDQRLEHRPRGGRHLLAQERVTRLHRAGARACRRGVVDPVALSLPGVRRQRDALPPSRVEPPPRDRRALGVQARE